MDDEEGKMAIKGNKINTPCFSFNCEVDGWRETRKLIDGLH